MKSKFEPYNLYMITEPSRLWLITLIMLLFCCPSISANNIINPSFELDGGNLYWEGDPPTGWSKTNHPNFGCDDEPHWVTDGQYSLHLYSYTNSDFVSGDYESVYQMVDLTNISNILFDIRLSIPYGGGFSYDLFDHFKALLLIDEVAYWSQEIGGIYVDQSIDVTNLSGSHKLELRNQAIDTGGYTDSYWTEWDNLRMTPIVLAVEIDIKPGSFPNPINLGSHGLTPVAIFSTVDFDATSVNPITVNLAGAPVAKRGKDKFMAHEEDVNGDSLVDLVVQVATAGINPTLLKQDGDVTYAVLTGNTSGGEAIEGEDEIVIVPPK